MTENSPQSDIPKFGDVAKAWEKWEIWLQPCYRSFNNLFLEAAGVRRGQKVLDLGCGAGYISVITAELLGPEGSVVGLDVSEEMIGVATRRAKELGLPKTRFQTCDITSLPFADNSFDAATARFVLMFIPDIDKALSEVYRILKQGAEFAASVWAEPEKNPLPRNVLMEYFTLPRIDPSVPGHYRFSKPGILKRLLDGAGFSKVQEQEIKVEEVFTNPEQFLEHLLESSALWGSLLRKLPAEKFAEATQKLMTAAAEFKTDHEIHIPRTARIISGEK